MKRLFAITGLGVWFGIFPAHGAADQASPASCVDRETSADYVPGVDVQGRSVAPADLPSASNIQVGTEIHAHVKTNNPQVPTVDVAVNLDGLQPLPPCRTSSADGNSSPTPRPGN